MHLVDPDNPRFRAADDAARFHVAAIGPIEDQNGALLQTLRIFHRNGFVRSEVAIQTDHEDIVDRIHGDSVRALQLCVRPFDDTDRRDVTVGLARINRNCVAGVGENLVVNRVHVQSATDGSGLWTLDDSNWRFLSIGSAAERQNCLSVGDGHDDLIMHSVIADVVHCSGKFAGLTVERSNRRLSSVRQPGEYRNLRMGHSVGHQNLFPLAVVADGARISDHEANCPGGSSSNRS